MKCFAGWAEDFEKKWKCDVTLHVSSYMSKFWSLFVKPFLYYESFDKSSAHFNDPEANDLI